MVGAGALRGNFSDKSSAEGDQGGKQNPRRQASEPRRSKSFTKRDRGPVGNPNAVNPGPGSALVRSGSPGLARNTSHPASAQVMRSKKPGLNVAVATQKGVRGGGFNMAESATLGTPLQQLRAEKTAYEQE